MKRFLIAAATCAGLGGAAAAEDYSVEGTGVGSQMNEVMPVTESLVLVKAATEYTGFETSSADNPLANLKGTCFGSMIIDEGAISGGGNCHYTDADGDVAIMSWTAEKLGPDGRTMGSWEVAGGTGKWAEASGGGAFNAGEDDAGTYTNEVTGELTMP